ncbi:MAG: acyl-CoA synthetase [Alphaproteobacteria bacterium]|nr:acyl-CoA synthetase [Alphaproteobacteria bacterium]
MVNLSAFIRFHAAREPGRVALVYQDRRVSFGELDERIGRLAGWLTARGIGAGDVVAAFMKNSAAFIDYALAASHIGAVFLPINYRLAREEVRYILGNAEAKLLLADDEFRPVVDGLGAVVYLDAAMRGDSRALAGHATIIPPIVTRLPSDLFRLMYTSGTTDRPKGVMHSYENFYWKCMDHIIALGLSARDRLLVVGPLYHVGACDLPGLAVLWVGGMLYIHRDFDAARALASIEAERLTCAWLAPVMTGQILSLEGRERFDLSSFKWTIGGGEKTPEARIRAFSTLFKNARYIDGYGLTESCAGDTLMEAGKEIEKIGSTGRALAHVEIEIRDETGARLPPGEEGEICLRGPKITKGYWKDPEKTTASFFGAWFRTGDVGYLDSDGFLFLTDRKKDMIISGGENIASSEIERVIYQMPEVQDVAVVGVPDARWGERPVAVIVPKPGAKLDYPALERHCRASLAGFKVPSALHIRESLPRNPSGKILKRVLRAEFVEKE